MTLLERKKKKKEFQIREEFIQTKLFLYENSLFKSITPFLFNCVFVLRPLLFSSRRGRRELHAKKTKVDLQIARLAFTCPKLKRETLEKGVKYVQK